MRFEIVEREYKVSEHNSTVCGYPGRDFDWSLFDWVGGKLYKSGWLDGYYSPEPWVDNGRIAHNCQYLHVAYNFEEAGVIYRVRPNECMYAGEVYRGHLIVRQQAIKKDDGWYWRLELRRNRGNQ